MRAMLEVQTPTTNATFRDQHPRRSIEESHELSLLFVVVVLAADLHTIGDQALQKVSLIIQMTPYDRRLTCAIDQFGALLASLGDCAASFVALFREADSREREQNTGWERSCINQMLTRDERRKSECAILKPKVGRFTRGPGP